MKILRMFGSIAVSSMLALGFAACGDGNPSGSNGDGSGSSVVTSPSIKVEKGTVKDSRDGKVYKTVKIGTQTWMAENLNYAYTGVPYKFSSFTSDSTSWCYYNDPANCEKYGRLYTWSAVMDSAAQFSENARTKCGFGTECTPNTPHRGICPKGWHVPTNGEYSTLYTYIGGSSTAGLLLKSTSGWYSSGNGTDKYGFSVLPAGYRDYYGYFGDEDRYAYLWTASVSDSNYAWDQFFDYSDDAWHQYFYYGDDYAAQSFNGKSLGRSLRCLKD